MPELCKSNHRRHEFLFRLGSPQPAVTECAWLHHWSSSGGEIWLCHGKQGSWHLLQFPRLADFRIAANMKDICCTPVSEVPAATITHLFLDQVLPRCLAHQGRIVLHASAVQLPQGLILFIGDSGVGKSTLAGNFHQAGDPVVSDDCIWVKESDDRIVAVPSYGGLRLWEDSLEALFLPGQETHSMAHYTTKKRVALQEQLPAPEAGIPVLALVAISPPERGRPAGIVLDQLSAREAFIAVLKQTFQLNLTDPERMTHHVRALGRIIPEIPAYRLSMPRDFTLLSLVRQRILEAVL